MSTVLQQPPVSLEVAEQLGLRPEEFERIQTILGRMPNFTELSIFSVMWSEHCSYKNSIKWLKTLPRDGERMLSKAGEENAGVVDLGDGLGCSFKIESHNHPSAIEPYQGAATGVGGINRDIFTMGARPVAQLNSLRFGDLTNPKTQWLLRGVVKGIGDYGNAFGVPTVGGEVCFDPCYQTNPLVNAFSAGILKADQIASAIAKGEGNPVFIVGSATGKDGIHGATFASEETSEESESKLPSVQVGDPFQEKLLLEATLEVLETGAVVGIQDMGAAGIICSTSEMSAKGESGMQIHLEKVPARQAGMKPFELLLSESQERMLIVVHKGREKDIQTIFDKWDLPCANIGEVTGTGQLEFFMEGEKVAEVPAWDLVLGGGAPVYNREYSEPAYYKEYQKFQIDSVEEPKDLKAVAEWLIAQPNIASKRWVFSQYDSMVGTDNASTNQPSDASIVRIKGTNKAIAITVDCQGRYVYADPKVGAMIAVSEAARNVVCAGGEPVAITNCLNFGNPYKPEVYWHFVNAIQGMGAACERLGTPVTGGNVSFYNQKTNGEPVFPTPTIGMLGVIDDLSTQTPLGFQADGDRIYLLGPLSNCINSSEYLYNYHGVKASPAPFFDMETEANLQAAVFSLIRSQSIRSAHDVADGGLFVTLAEAGFVNGLGFSVSTEGRGAVRTDAFLFGEGQSRVVVSVSTNKAAAFEAKTKELAVDCLALGIVTSGAFQVDGTVWGDAATYQKKFEATLPALLDG